MKHSTLRALGLPVVLSALVLGAGCATRADLDDVRKLAQDADADVKKLAQDAKVSADQANRTAAEAKEIYAGSIGFKNDLFRMQDKMQPHGQKCRHFRNQRNKLVPVF